MFEKQGQTMEAIKDMHQDMNSRFDWLAEQYGEFGEVMRSINEKLDTISQLQQDFHEMKGAFIKLTEYLINKK